MFRWPVVPLCEKQLRDVSTDDILEGGDFRKCNVYKGGGGYDRFPYICERRLGKKFSNQFVVQLKGCPFKCPYCYVTNEGIWGKAKEYTSLALIKHFINSKQEVFHLMGGAPALYIEHWPELLDLMPEDKVFHSDLLLLEKPYTTDWLTRIDRPNTLFTVSIKGATASSFKENTGIHFNEELFWANLNFIVHSNINFYITFTNPDIYTYAFQSKLIKRYGSDILRDSFSIELIKYKALEEGRINE